MEKGNYGNRRHHDYGTGAGGNESFPFMIGILSQIMGYRNGESGQHILRINIITEILLDELARKTDVYQLSWSDRSVITIASALHDIGKIGISEGILNKQEKLTLEEEQIVQAHTLIGAALLKKSGVISE